jgi:DNA helicase-2/ATP-dependent DNA helicase PcrA
MTTVTEENSEEEERRLFYVAMTRAKKGLYITNSHYYPVNQSVREVVRSRFIEEIDNQLLEKNEVLHTEATALPTLQSLFAPLKEADYTEEEHFFLQNLLEHFSLSVTALSNYMTCPRLFKYQNLLRLPRTVEGERDQDKILYLGTAVHSALEAFFREIQHGTTPDLAFLTAHFKEALNKELISKEAYEDTLAEGEKIVSAYYEHYQNTWQVPIHLEYGFYNVFLGDIPLTGKVDKIERLDEGQKTVKVVDYKTSTPKSQNEIKGLTKNGDGALYRQLVFYKLLGDLDKKFSYTYGTISECELDFVKPNKSGLFKRESFSIPEQDINELIETIKIHMEMIRSLRFDKINDMAICRECPYQKICWGRKL